MIADVWVAIGFIAAKAAPVAGIGLTAGLVILVVMTVIVMFRYCQKP